MPNSRPRTAAPCRLQGVTDAAEDGVISPTSCLPVELLGELVLPGCANILLTNGRMQGLRLPLLRTGPGTSALTHRSRLLVGIFLVVSFNRDAARSSAKCGLTSDAAKQSNFQHRPVGCQSRTVTEDENPTDQPSSAKPLLGPQPLTRHNLETWSSSRAQPDVVIRYILSSDKPSAGQISAAAK